MEGKKQIVRKSNFLLKKYNFRKNIINYIYQFELFDKSLNTKEIVDNKLNEITNAEIQTLELIEAKYQTLTNIAKKFILENWEWERISPLIRAIIIFGIYELTFNESKVVINEIINITKLFSPGEEYKFVNKVLDKISKQIINK
ncbi:transcription antitermination protein NusB [Mycoplasmopsis arginini]|uniref:transcription antitermination protein NusB n=1 Tax=Mycoplasmopsis arginini TaxID=2094 RepID=UPI000D60F23C|nr:transcription antitermination protein NusB [Mycoplasmopsis arginini]PWC08870.1 transcription antitermination protein NusB [Mycoplasmopsis arginini]